MVTFLFDFGTPAALGPEKGPEGLVAACLLDAQAPPQWSNTLINRLQYYVLQLGDPNPNPYLLIVQDGEPGGEWYSRLENTIRLLALGICVFLFCARNFSKCQGVL